MTGTPDWLPGKFGNGLNFVEADSESAFIDGLPAYRATDSFTIAFWMNQNQGYRNRPFESQSILIFDYMFYSFGSPWDSTSMGFQSDSVWHHVVFSFDDPDKGKKVYVDAVVLESNQMFLSDTVLDGFYMKLGIHHDSYKRGGMFDDLAVWDRALTLDEVESLVLFNEGEGRVVQEAEPIPSAGTMLMIK